MKSCIDALRGLAVLCLLAIGSGCAAPDDTGSTGSLVEMGPREKLILGVQTHFAYDRSVDAARVVEWIKAARVDSTRDEMFWGDVEDARGAYGLRNGAEFARTAWWSQMPQTAPLMILGYGHPNYDGGGQPRSDTAVSAFADHARWLVGQTRSRVRMVEVWNEWNGKAGAQAPAGAQGGPADYVRLAAATLLAVKAVDPDVRVLVGGLAEDVPDWRWMRAALPLGLLEGADGVSVHLYNHCDRAHVGADEMLRRLEALQSLLKNHAHREIPIYVTEVGWPTHRGACHVTEPDAGIFTLRLLLEASLRSWLKGVWIYETIDSGSDANNREHRFGLLRRDGTERPAGCMVRAYGAVISSRPVQVMQQGRATVAVFHEAQKTWVFAWAREGGRGVRVSMSTSTSDSALPLAAEGCPLNGATTAMLDGRLVLRAELADATPVAFVLPKFATLTGVRID